jgi:hypothetical protein
MNLRSLDDNVALGAGAAVLAALAKAGAAVVVACLSYVPAAWAASGTPAPTPSERIAPAINVFLKSLADMMVTSHDGIKERRVCAVHFWQHDRARVSPKRPCANGSMVNARTVVVNAGRCVGFIPTKCQSAVNHRWRFRAGAAT